MVIPGKKGQPWVYPPPSAVLFMVFFYNQAVCSALKNSLWAARTAFSQSCSLTPTVMFNSPVNALKELYF